MYDLNFILGWTLFFLFLVSFGFFAYLFGRKKAGGWKTSCAFVLVIFFLASSTHFIRSHLKTYVAQKVLLGQTVAVCGSFLRMEDGNDFTRGKGTPNQVAVFLVDKTEKRFGQFFYGTKEKILQLTQGDSKCLTYIPAPFPRRGLIVVGVRKVE